MENSDDSIGQWRGLTVVPSSHKHDYAISQMRRCWGSGSGRPATNLSDTLNLWGPICTSKNRFKGSVMGYSVRTMDYRYTVWLHWVDSTRRPDLGRGVVAEELYSHVGARVQDISVERENLLPSRREDVQDVARAHLDRVLLHLRSEATYGFQHAAEVTKKYWSSLYSLDKNGRVRVVE